MSAYQRPPTTKTTTTTTTAAAAQGHQFPSLLDDKLIIYGNGLVYGGATYPSPADNVLMQSTPQMAAGGQRLPTQHNSSFTGIPNRPTPRVTGSNSRPPTQQQMHQLHQQQQQQTLQQPQQQQMTQSHELSRGPQYPRYMNQQQPLQQQQQQPLQQQQQQQQLQQAYNYWPFGGMAPTHAVNNNMGMFNGHANQPPQMYNNQMSYGQTWPGYTVMSPADPNKPYTFGMD